MENPEIRRREVSLSEMLLWNPKAHKAFINGYIPSPRLTPDVGRMNIGIVTSAKENLKLMKNDLDNDLTIDLAVFRNLVNHLAFLSAFDGNPFSLHYNLRLIANIDSDENYVYPYPAARPWLKESYSVIKDDDGKPISTPTIDGITHETPAYWQDFEGRIGEGGEYEDPSQRDLKVQWEDELTYLLYDRRIDLVLSDCPPLTFGGGVPKKAGILPIYANRIALLEPYSNRGEDAKGDGVRANGNDQTVMSLITQSGKQVISYPDPNSSEVELYGSCIAAVLGGLDLLANTQAFRQIVSRSRETSEVYDKYESTLLFGDLEDYLMETRR